MKLTNTQIRNAKPKKKIYKLFDGDGLFLKVTPIGSKLWRLKYYFENTEKSLSFGKYPEASLKRAREKKLEARSLLAEGIDPSENRKAMKMSKEIARSNTLEVIAREWIAFKGKQKQTKGGFAERYTKDLENRLAKNLFPYLGRQPITKITAPEILKVVRKIEDRGAFETAHRVLQTLGQIFRYAIATSRAEYDPTRDLKEALIPVKKGHRAAMVRPEEVAELMRAIDGYQGDEVTRCALKLAAFFFVRPGELRKAKWEEVDFENKLWVVPAERMKIKTQDHFVPLCTQVLEILSDLKELTGHREFLFPAPRDWRRPMSDNTFNAALRRMGFSKEQMTAHGFRAIARTLLDEVLHCRVDFIEHQLAHSVRDATGRAYNRTTHLEERRKMMQVWGDYLEGLKESKIISLTNRVVRPKYHKTGKSYELPIV